MSTDSSSTPNRREFMQYTGTVAAGAVLPIPTYSASTAAVDAPVTTPPLPTAAVDYYLKISGVDGESQDKDHKGEIDILSWGFGGGADDSDSPSFAPVVVTKLVDSTTPQLYRLRFGTDSSTPPPTATLAARFRGDRTDFLTLDLADVGVRDICTAGFVGEHPFEVVTLDVDPASVQVRETDFDFVTR